jgi:predicted SAM-dependent methyltransferase
VGRRAGWSQLQHQIVSLARRGLSATRRRGPARAPFEPGGTLADIHHTRGVIAAIYLKGAGIEIGALHQPLSVPRGARVQYVDRMTAPELQRHYPEISTSPFVAVDIIDDGEQLTKLADGSQDFVIANHFLEHCQNPIRTFQNFLRVLKPEGVLYVAVPDKRFTFDADRPPTTIEHVMRDFAEGPEWSKRQHFEEWSRLVNKAKEEHVPHEVEHLLGVDYSIHFHVWRAADLLELIATMQRFLQFELELLLRNGFETVLILRKTSD